MYVKVIVIDMYVYFISNLFQIVRKICEFQNKIYI